MAEKRASRKVRFNFFKDFYGLYTGNYMTLEQAKQNVYATGHVLFESELDKFHNEFPDIEADSFDEFIKEVNGLKSVKRDTSGNRGTRLASKEKATALGVPEDKFEDYVNELETIAQAKANLREMISTDYSISFSITKSKKQTPQG